MQKKDQLRKVNVKGDGVLSFCCSSGVASLLLLPHHPITARMDRESVQQPSLETDDDEADEGDAVDAGNRSPKCDPLHLLFAPEDTVQT